MIYRIAAFALLLLPGMAQAKELEDILPRATVLGTRFQPASGSEAHDERLTIECSDGDLSVGGCCLFDSPPCDSTYEYMAGDVPALSTYWNEVVDCSAYDCSNYEVLWSLAMGNPQSGSKVPLFLLEPVSFGDVSAFDGLELTFCVFSGLELPPQSQGLICNFGFWVKTPIDDYDGPFFHTDGFAVTASSACTPYSPGFSAWH